MKTEKSLYRARVCAVVSLVLFVAVVTVGARRSASEPPVRAEMVYTAEYEIASFAADRNAVRREELSQLEALAVDELLSQAVRDEAARRIMQLRGRMEQESVIAQVLAARGYHSPVVTVQDNSVNVVVRCEALSAREAEIIIELVTRQTGVTGGNVKIIPIN